MLDRRHEGRGMPDFSTQTVDHPAATSARGAVAAPDPAEQYAPVLDPPAPRSGGETRQQHDEHGLPIDPDYTPRFGDTRVGAPETVDAEALNAEAADGEPPLTETEKGYLDRSIAFPNGRSYFGTNDQYLRSATANITANEGWYIVSAHGQPTRISLPNADDSLEELTPAQFKRILDNDPTWDGTSNVVFISCELGETFVAELYELYGRQVTMEGPKDIVIVEPDGSLTASRLVRDPVTGQPELDEAGDLKMVPVDKVLWFTYEKETPSPEGQADAQGTPV
jgi:hypothetical protein